MGHVITGLLNKLRGLRIICADLCGAGVGLHAPYCTATGGVMWTCNVDYSTGFCTVGLYKPTGSTIFLCENELFLITILQLFAAKIN